MVILLERVTNHCSMTGSVSRALLPRSLRLTGTLRQPSTVKPFLVAVCASPRSGVVLAMIELH